MRAGAVRARDTSLSQSGGERRWQSAVPFARWYRAHSWPVAFYAYAYPLLTVGRYPGDWCVNPDLGGLTIGRACGTL